MGGAEVFTREVAKRMVEQGHEVTLFISEFQNCKMDEVMDGVRIVRAGGSTLFTGRRRATTGSSSQGRVTTS
jgi:Trk K+ transport system NAD-binding subunit